MLRQCNVSYMLHAIDMRSWCDVAITACFVRFGAEPPGCIAQHPCPAATPIEVEARSLQSITCLDHLYEYEIWLCHGKKEYGAANVSYGWVRWVGTAVQGTPEFVQLPKRPRSVRFIYCTMQ